MNLDNVLVYTDSHFYHQNIMKFCAKTRPYSSVDEMNSDLIAKWNNRAKGKTIFFLGDFSFSRSLSENQAIFDQLEGDKHLIKGNHDHKETYKLNWSSISDYKRLNVGPDTFVLFHYPMSSWDKMAHGSYHLYGHVHGDNNVPGKLTKRMFEPSMDNGFPEPLTLKEVKNMLVSRTEGMIIR